MPPRPLGAQAPEGTHVVYDSGALVAASKLDGAFRAFHRGALAMGLTPVVPAPVLAESYSGGPVLDHFLAGCAIEGLSGRAAKRAGRIRAAAGRGSAVDAVCIETALRYRASCVTSDAADLRALGRAAGRTVPLIEI